jgi:hypothetical protein
MKKKQCRKIQKKELYGYGTMALARMIETRVVIFGMRGVGYEIG